MTAARPEYSHAVRVIFAGGGTGGHVYPALAMYEGLRAECGENGVAALFVGAKGGLDKTLLSNRGVDYRLLPGRGLRGASLGGKLRAPLDVIAGVTRSLAIIREFRPDVVVGTGGYASVSMVLAAIVSGTPRILQEQNSVPGLVNRRLARFADLVLLSFEDSGSVLPAVTKTAVIGNPLRRTPDGDRTAGAAFLGLDPARPTVLVIGGSRGAHSLNEAAAAAAAELLGDSDTQFVLLTGENDYETVRRRVGEAWPGRVAVRAYLEEVHHAYRAADVAVARAGASSVFELAASGLPAIFVPYPYAADDHQRLNAEPLVRAGAAEIIPDPKLNGAVLAASLRRLLGDPVRRQAMGEAMLTWAGGDSARLAAGKILSLLEGKHARPEKSGGGGHGGERGKKGRRTTTMFRYGGGV
jgi:UDP-N-acetylglucosamine--N-acetylmuramyl-(pentapeptide) pyrophosphoryl-undecaprenol N-acetylglucosamine transferase